MGVLAALPRALGEQANGATSEYWLEHSEGFQVLGPNGRVGFVALVLSADEGVDGLVIRTGLLRTRSVFVPIHQVKSVAPRRQQLELLVAPSVPRARLSDFVRELSASAAGSLPLRRDEASGLVNRSSEGGH